MTLFDGIVANLLKGDGIYHVIPSPGYIQQLFVSQLYTNIGSKII